MKPTYIDVGVVRQLFRYPVKSFAGEAVEATRAGWHGHEGDGRFAFVRSDNMTGFPWLTAREVPSLVLYRPYFVKPEAVRDSPVSVITPRGADVALDSEDLRRGLAEAYGSDVRLMQLWSGIFDAMDISLITSATLSSVGEFVGREVDVRRFRPNILIESFDGKAFPEDKWVGELLVFGARPDSLRVRAKRKDVRCKIVNIDPDTGEREPSIFREIVTKRKNFAGVYGTTEWPGTVNVGDVVRLAKY